MSETAPSRPCRVLFLEPFHGGSHREFAAGLLAHTRHRIRLMALPGRFWKWRMRGAALHWAPVLPPLETVDILLTTGHLSLAELKGVVGGEWPPVLLYFHENQLTYPLGPGERLDAHFAVTNITSALAADRVVFNSAFQMNAFFDRLPPFLQQMPDRRPMWVIDAIRSKSSVLHPGCRIPEEPGERLPADGRDGGPPIVVWNHRWEFDKNPDAFFRCLSRIRDRGVGFRVAVLGERFREAPLCFREALEALGDRIVQFGFEPDRFRYRRWLERATVVVSTAYQENFGMSVVEAVAGGCLPLLPARLAYPEVIPRRYHDDFLYPDEAALTERLASILENPAPWREKAAGLPEAMARYAWHRRIAAFDELIDQTARPPRRR